MKKRPIDLDGKLPVPIRSLWKLVELLSTAPGDREALDEGGEDLRRAHRTVSAWLVRLERRPRHAWYCEDDDETCPRFGSAQFGGRPPCREEGGGGGVEGDASGERFDHPVRSGGHEGTPDNCWGAGASDPQVPRDGPVTPAEMQPPSFEGAVMRRCVSWARALAAGLWSRWR
jgi:hypothetical protein